MGSVPGIKVDMGAKHLPGIEGEKALIEAYRAVDS